MQRLSRLWVVLAVALAILTACSVRSAQGQSPSTASGSAARSDAKTAAQDTSRAGGAPTRSRRVTKLLVFVEENHAMRQMRQGMPYTSALARRYGYATSYYAVAHPSLPNYLAIAGGTTYGVDDDGPPSQHRIGGASVFGQALRQGRTAALYVDGMPGNCATRDGGNDYAVKHNPWPYFVREARQCRAHDVPVTRLAGDIARGRLPNAGMVVPNRCHDAHDCDLSVADRWLRGYLTKVFAGPDWRSGHLAVVVTADEDDHSAGNKVLTVVVHPSQHGKVVRTRLDHYALTRLYDDVLHAPYLHRAASAASMAKAFGLPVG